jgi:hypothetical protein
VTGTWSSHRWAKGGLPSSARSQSYAGGTNNGSGPKRCEDIAYGWKGKGSTVHLITEGNGLPLAFLVTAANVSEVPVGLEVVDRVKVPRPQGRPRQRPASLAADKNYDSIDFRWELRRRGIQPSIPRREWKTVADGQVDLRWCIQLARVGGR